MVDIISSCLIPHIASLPDNAMRDWRKRRRNDARSLDCRAYSPPGMSSRRLHRRITRACRYDVVRYSLA